MYDFDAGDLSLDFANTLSWHASAKPVEDMPSYSDLVEWGRESGLVSPDATVQLLQLLDKHPEEAQKAYAYAIQVREAIYRIYSHRYAGKPIPEDDLAILNKLVSEASTHRQLVPDGDKLHWQWTDGINVKSLILWPVAHSAAELLTSEGATRVRVCEDDRGCGFLFIDNTKNHSRRWCSMESCGNRAKARRHYSRVTAG